jgi:hypothetical protein
MPNLDEWLKRRTQRTDISGSLVHLTKSSDKLNVWDVLMQVLENEYLIGSTTASGFICGNTPAVCLQDIPLYSVAQNVYYEQNLRKQTNSPKIRYLGVGLVFKKPDVFLKGGRPVIYEKTEIAKSILPREEWWRIVNLDLSNNSQFIDWTHEREWRVPNKLTFNLSEISVVVPSEIAYKSFIQRCKAYTQKDILSEIRSIINLGDLFY